MSSEKEERKKEEREFLEFPRRRGRKDGGRDPFHSFPNGHGCKRRAVKTHYKARSDLDLRIQTGSRHCLRASCDLSLGLEHGMVL